MTRNWTQHYVLIPTLTFLAIAAGLVAIWYRLHIIETDMLDLRTRTTTEQVAFRFENFIGTRLRLVSQMTHQWLHNQINTPERFREVALSLKTEFDSFQAINWVDRDGVIRWVVPEKENLAAKDRDLRAHAGMAKILDKARREGLPRASNPLYLFQGGRGLGTYFPIVRDGTCEGFINGVFRIQPLVADCLQRGVLGDFYLRIADGSEPLFTEGPADIFNSSPRASSFPLKVLDREWMVTLVPTQALVGQYATSADEIFLAIGLLVAAGLGLTLKAYLQRHNALLESEQRLRLTQYAMDNAAVATFWVQQDARLSYANQAACKSLGYTREELQQLRVFDIDPNFTPEIWPAHWERVNSIAGEQLTFESLQRRKDGSTFPAEITSSPLHYKGRFYHFASCKDITERKRAEEERLAIERGLLETQRLESLGLLAGGVAHDFNNLLTAMMGSVSLARQMVPTASSLSDHLLHIESAAQQAADLSRQLLAYSGKGKFVLSVVDLRQVIEETGHLLRVSIPKSVAVEYELGDAPVSTMADAAQMRQIVMNLVINAAEAVGDGLGVISVHTARVQADRAMLADMHADVELPEGPYALLEVSDTGCGMDAALRARVFEPFFSTKSTGRGLGLAAVLGIVRGHRGGIRIDSQPGEGTAVQVMLPGCDMPAKLQSVSAPVQVTQINGGGTILVVDDEQSVRTVARLILEDSGYTVLTAQNGEEGVEAFRRQPDEIKVVLLDLTMPRMDGGEVLRIIREIKPQVRVLLSSGYDQQEAAGELVGGHVTDFIQKPYRADQLLQKLRDMLAN